MFASNFIIKVFKNYKLNQFKSFDLLNMKFCTYYFWLSLTQESLMISSNSFPVYIVSASMISIYLDIRD